MQDRDTVLDFRLLPEPRNSRTVRDEVTRFARRHCVPADDLEFFVTALGEAVANAIEHAEVADPIAIEIRIGRGRIVAKVTDAGVGFKAPRQVDPVFPEPAAECGRGLAIIRHCSDIFALTSAPGNGTQIIFGRAFSRQATRERNRLSSQPLAGAC